MKDKEPKKNNSYISGDYPHFSSVANEKREPYDVSTLEITRDLYSLIWDLREKSGYAGFFMGATITSALAALALHETPAEKMGDLSSTLLYLTMPLGATAILVARATLKREALAIEMGKTLKSTVENSAENLTKVLSSQEIKNRVIESSEGIILNTTPLNNYTSIHEWFNQIKH